MRLYLVRPSFDRELDVGKCPGGKHDAGTSNETSSVRLRGTCGGELTNLWPEGIGSLNSKLGSAGFSIGSCARSEASRELADLPRVGEAKYKSTEPTKSLPAETGVEE